MYRRNSNTPNTNRVKTKEETAMRGTKRGPANHNIAENVRRRGTKTVKRNRYRDGRSVRRERTDVLSCRTTPKIIHVCTLWDHAFGGLEATASLRFMSREMGRGAGRLTRAEKPSEQLTQPNSAVATEKGRKSWCAPWVARRRTSECPRRYRRRRSPSFCFVRPKTSKRRRHERARRR